MVGTVDTGAGPSTGVGKQRDRETDRVTDRRDILTMRMAGWREAMEEAGLHGLHGGSAT